MALFTSIVTAGTNNHQTTAEEANRFTTNFVTPGFVGTLTNTAGVAPMTGAYAVNAQGTPNKTVTIAGGDVVIATTPTGQASQNLTVRNTALINPLTIPDNTSGSIMYDWIYVVTDAIKANNPATDASDVASILVNRSTSATTDTSGAIPAFANNIAVITVNNGFTTIVAGNIADKRIPAGAALPDGSVSAQKLATSAITLGYTTSTSNYVQGTATITQITGLTSTVTIPAGGRKVKITGFLPAVSMAGSAAGVTLTIWDGTVGSGTQLAAAYIYEATTGVANFMTCIAIVTPAAGNKTYNLGMSVSTNTATSTQAATSPAFILVEAI